MTSSSTSHRYFASSMVFCGPKVNRMEPWPISSGRPMLSSTWLGSSEPDVQAEPDDALMPSHVLLAIGRPHEVAHGSLRLTICEDNTEEEIDYILAELPPIVDDLRNMSPVWKDLMSGKRLFTL